MEKKIHQKPVSASMKPKLCKKNCSQTIPLNHELRKMLLRDDITLYYTTRTLERTGDVPTQLIRLPKAQTHSHNEPSAINHLFFSSSYSEGVWYRHPLANINMAKLNTQSGVSKATGKVENNFPRRFYQRLQRKRRHT